MTGSVLRAGPWTAVASVSGLALLVGGAGAAFPAAAAMLFPVCFALLAAAAAFTLDEPASAVVDVTPTRLRRWTAVRALALAVPSGAGAAVVLAGGRHEVALPWASVWVALAGSVLLGFTLACVARRRVGEPGAVAAPAAALALIVPGMLPRVTRLVHTFPAGGQPGWSSDACWALLGGACVVAIAVALTERRPAGRSRLRVRAAGGAAAGGAPVKATGSAPK
jgi:hypothetical protein